MDWNTSFAKQLGQATDMVRNGNLMEATQAIQKALAGGAEAVAPLAQIDPGVMDIFRPDEIARELAEINGVPAKILRSKEEVTAIKEGQAQAAEAQQLLAAAPVAAQTAKTLAEVQALSGNVPAALPI